MAPDDQKLTEYRTVPVPNHLFAYLKHFNSVVDPDLDL